MRISKRGLIAATLALAFAAVAFAQTAPVFTTQPADRLVGEGSSFSVSVAVNTSADLSPVTWKINLKARTLTASTVSVSQTGTAMTASLTFGPVTSADDGNFQIVATNAYGSTLSVVRTLTTFSAAASIATQPVSVSAAVGSNVTFSVVTAGSAPILYQWSKDSVAISGATNSSLTLTAIAASAAGSYTVRVSNFVGAETSSPAVLTVTTPVAPAITTQPISQSVSTSGNATFSVVATGSPAPTYQWSKDAVAIPGATNSTYTVTGAASAAAGFYTVLVANSAGSVTSTPATLTVLAATLAPLITTQPASQSVAVGVDLTFTVVASGSSPLTYQWRKDGVAITGATSSTFTISGATLTAAGNYTVVVTNSVASVTSNAAPLTVTSVAVTPTITTQPLAQAVVVGGSATFTVVATGTPAPTYQWSKDAVTINGATNATYTVSNVTTTAAGSYTVTVTNSAGSVISNAAALTVATGPAAPVIVSQPFSQSAILGATVTLAVVATGVPTPTYQWSRNGAPISGATSATYRIQTVTTGDFGTYTVVVGNTAGSVTSAPAALSLAIPATSAISNVSVRTTMAASQTLIMGFTMSGGTKQILLRAVGPGLSIFGVPNVMTDPKLALFKGTTLVDTNDNWGGTAPLGLAFAAVGAFPFSFTSLDAALLSTIEGGYTAQVTGTGPGAVLVEVYDVGTGVSPRLTNVSARNRVGTGSDILIAGFTVAGSGTKNLLIRAVGPTLTGFAVNGVLADPKLEVYSGTTLVAKNDTWSADLASVFSSVGAFALTPGSKDAALTVSLPPGGYTVQVSGADGGTGEALVEIYELP